MRILFLLAVMTVVSCVNYPVATGGMDLYEMESVWQYLKVYSILQDRVPQSAFQFDSPETMLYSINDTLDGGRYTRYEDDFGLSKTIAAEDYVSLWDSTLTDSTVYVRISFFSEEDLSTYDTFVSHLPFYQKFSNMIIDLIDNRGGGIAPADSIINCILPANTPYMLRSYRKYNQQTRQASTVEWDTIKALRGQHWALKNKRYVLLVNGLSASSSEIMIAALVDGFANVPGAAPVVLVGETTFGKGIGQIRIFREYLHRSNLLITFMLMKGLSERTGDYHRKGITSDIYVESPPEKTDHNKQISKALQILEPYAQFAKFPVLSEMSISTNRFRVEANVVATPDDKP